MPVSTETRRTNLHIGDRARRRLLQIDDIVDRVTRVPANGVPADRREELVFVARALRPGEIGDDTTDETERPHDGDRGEEGDDGHKAAPSSSGGPIVGGSVVHPRSGRPGGLVIRTTRRRGGPGVHRDHGRSGIGVRRGLLDLDERLTPWWDAADAQPPPPLVGRSGPGRRHARWEGPTRRLLRVARGVNIYINCLERALPHEAAAFERPVHQHDLRLQLISRDRAEVARVGRPVCEVALDPILIVTEVTGLRPDSLGRRSTASRSRSPAAAGARPRPRSVPRWNRSGVTTKHQSPGSNVGAIETPSIAIRAG